MSYPENPEEGSYNRFRFDVDVSHVPFVYELEQESFGIARIMDYPIVDRTEITRLHNPDGSMETIRVPIGITPDEEQQIADVNYSLSVYLEAYGRDNVTMVGPTIGLVNSATEPIPVTCAVIMVRGLLDS